MLKDLKRILKIALREKGLTLFVFLLAISSSIISLASPWIFKFLIDLMVNIKAYDSLETAFSVLSKITLGLIVIYSLDIVQSLTMNYWGNIWYLRIVYDVTKDSFSHLHSLSLSYFEKNSVGKIKEQVDKGVWDMQAIIDDFVQELLPQAILVVLAIVILARINVSITLLSFVGLPFFALVTLKRTRILNQNMDKIRDIYERASAIVMESIIGVKTVKSFNREEFEKKNHSKTLNNALSLYKWRYKKRNRLNLIRFSIINGTRVLVIFCAGILAIKGKITAGDIYLFYAYISKIYDPFQKLVKIYDRTHERMRSVKRVLDLIDTEPEVKDETNAKKLLVKQGKISFKNVTFAYEKKHILKNVSFDADPGQVIALVGPSGVGKSTIAKLIMRFYNLNSGKILIDNKDISKVTQESLRENIGVVLQDTQLFNDTVVYNLKYGNLKAKSKDIIAAARVANADDFIQKLPKGYNTLVGERGIKLSGGEQQRINIARAVLKNPPILILDEATSHLDSESEMLVQDALWKLIKGRTTIIIAHRLSTVMRADKILVLNKGKIVEEGTHEELLRENGLYAKLFKIQSGAMLLTEKEEDTEEENLKLELKSV
ncbi:MAG: ABC transporter ATP-binding protein/permease [Patescibacteria group bacterium]|nr:ABC transporter ATP-binding protein/permease [Patescibacteria group bacterium]